MRYALIRRFSARAFHLKIEYQKYFSEGIRIAYAPCYFVYSCALVLAAPVGLSFDDLSSVTVPVLLLRAGADMTPRTVPVLGAENSSAFAQTTSV